MVDVVLMLFAAVIVLWALVLPGLTAAVASRYVGVRPAVRWWALNLVKWSASMLAFVLAPLAVMLARRDEITEKEVHSAVPLYRLPSWASWMETPDDPMRGRLPGGLYEPDIMKVYQRYGWRVAAIAWLWRNRAYRVAMWLGADIITHEIKTAEHGMVSRQISRNASRLGLPPIEAWVTNGEVSVYDVHVHGPQGAFPRGLRVITAGEFWEVRWVSGWSFGGRTLYVRAGWKLQPLTEDMPSEIALSLPGSATGYLQQFSPRVKHIHVT